MADLSFLDKYRALKQEYPTTYTVAAIAPVTGQAIALADYADAIDRGDTGDAIVAAGSFIPGIKLAKFGGKLAPAAYELAASRAFQPSSARAVMAPVTANADRVGKAFAAEQVGEYAMKKAEAEARNRQDSEAYSLAWKDIAPK